MYELSLFFLSGVCRIIHVNDDKIEHFRSWIEDTPSDAVLSITHGEEKCYLFKRNLDFVQERKINDSETVSELPWEIPEEMKNGMFKSGDIH